MFKSNFTFQEKVVVITGASSGIGLACVQVLANKGAKVVMGARSFDKLKEIERSLTASGHSVIAVKTDVTQESDCVNLINSALNAFGRVDVLINNAGISMRALFVDTNIKVIRQLMEVNFFGTVYCTKHALPYLLESKGSIVGVSSIAGFHGLPGRTGYSASKFAMHGFLETLRIENLRNGLHVMIAAPGFTSTNVRRAALTADGTPQGYSPREEKKMMTATQVAERIAKGIMYRRRNVIMTFEGKFSVLLQRVVPHLLDYIFYRIMSKEPKSPFK
ncbi:MAG: SDR family oxidoreductase [Bacteroidales bacterium]|nr:SDR family oxidoreductase [Bacteroidales bacterium]MBN2749152.1 SDR family oxidoreductase [Bacteroidales bacterium]